MNRVELLDSKCDSKCHTGERKWEKWEELENELLGEIETRN